MNTRDGGSVYLGGEYSVTIVITNRRNGKLILEHEYIVTEIEIERGDKDVTITLSES